MSILAGTLCGIVFASSVVYCVLKMERIQADEGRLAASRFIRLQGSLMLGLVVLLSFVALKTIVGFSVASIGAFVAAFIASLAIYTILRGLKP